MLRNSRIIFFCFLHMGEAMVLELGLVLSQHQKVLFGVKYLSASPRTPQQVLLLGRLRLAPHGVTRPSRALVKHSPVKLAFTWQVGPVF